MREVGGLASALQEELHIATRGWRRTATARSDAGADLEIQGSGRGV